MHNVYTRHGALLLLLCITVGCSSSTTSDATETESGQHAEQVEHHLPEHRPASFAAAVEQISSRSNRIRDELQKATHEPLDRELSELLDILSWLPEIAGDSDLRRADWEVARWHADRLALLYQKLNSKPARVQFEPGSFDEITTLIEELRLLIPASIRKN